MALLPSLTRIFFFFVLAVCTALLGGALTLEHAYGVRPCLLCLYQRLPYVLAALIAAAGCLLPIAPRLRLGLGGLLAAAFAFNSGLGLFHLGVEGKLWTFSACTAASSASLDFETLTTAASMPLSPSCDAPQIYWFGLSLAAYTTFASLILALCTLVALWRTLRSGTKENRHV